MTTALVPADLSKQATYLDTVASENQLVMLNGSSGFAMALRVAYAVGRLRAELTADVMKHIMLLQNSSLGFRTDKKEGYPLEVVRDCLIEAVLRGGRPYGNEFNIIAERCYLTKEFYTRFVPCLPEVTEVSVSLGVPRMAGDKGAIVDCTATWKLAGRGQSLNTSPGKPVREIAVRVNAGMGADAILGKATRKAYKAIHDQITGWCTSDGEIEEAQPGDAYEPSTPATTTKRQAKPSPLNEEPAPKEAARTAGFNALVAAWLKSIGSAEGSFAGLPPTDRAASVGMFRAWASKVLGREIKSAIPASWTDEDIAAGLKALDAEREPRP